MDRQNHYNIGEMQRFSAADFPHISAELSKIVSDLHEFPVYFKKEIVVSYLRDHSIKSEWIEANPRLVKLLTSGVLATGQMEMLFERCRWNKPFRQDYERYIRITLV